MNRRAGGLRPVHCLPQFVGKPLVQKRLFFVVQLLEQSPIAEIERPTRLSVRPLPLVPMVEAPSGCPTREGLPQIDRKVLGEWLTANGAVPVIEEKWTVRVYGSGDQPLVDLESVQTCATDAPLVVNEYHYGGLALRGARDWFRQPQSGFLTSEGKTRSDGNHTRARWVIAHGLSGGQPAGICIVGHPQNFRSPQPVRLHPDKAYFCFSPMILGTFTIDPGRPYVSRYR